MCTYFRVLKDLGITGVVNAAQGSMEDWNYVKTGPAYYQAAGMGGYMFQFNYKKYIVAAKVWYSLPYMYRPKHRMVHVPNSYRYNDRQWFRVDWYICDSGQVIYWHGRY